MCSYYCIGEGISSSSSGATGVHQGKTTSIRSLLSFLGEKSNIEEPRHNQEGCLSIKLGLLLCIFKVRHTSQQPIPILNTACFYAFYSGFHSLKSSINLSTEESNEGTNEI